MLCGYRRSRWQSIRINGGKTTLGLGSYPEITLDMARERALENAPSGPRLPSRACSTPSPDYSTASSAAAFRAPSIIVQFRERIEFESCWIGASSLRVNFSALNLTN